MENKNQEVLVMKVIATLDAILNKMADVLDKSFDPEDVDSMKLLREFRATMNSRRSWAKFYDLNNDASDKICDAIQKVEKALIGQSAPAGRPPALKKPVPSALDETIFNGIKFKNNPIPQVDLNSGLIYRR